MRVKIFGVRFIFEVKSWRPLIILYGYVKKTMKEKTKEQNAT